MATTLLDSEIVYDRITRDYTILIAGVACDFGRTYSEAEGIRTQLLAERLGTIIQAFARRTERLASQLCHLAFRLSAEAGAQIGEQLGMPVSAATLLRLQRHHPLPPSPAAQIIGIDDWAICKGRTYGALIVDLERHQPIDVLPDAKAETFATWLQQHPSITLISRDRAGNFAEGAHRGAPQAIQVAAPSISLAIWVTPCNGCSNSILRHCEPRRSRRSSTEVWRWRRQWSSLPSSR